MDAQARLSSAEEIYDPDFVKGVFDRCSKAYISMSWIASFGFTERWRRQCVEALPLHPQQPVDGYDLMAGTGEVWPHLFRQNTQIRSVTAVDISSGMHQRALTRLHQHREHQIKFLEVDVLKSRLPEDSCDFIVSTFGLKTFNATQHHHFAELIARSCGPAAPSH
jgi:demethylmenaquinone methyltransferase/2-methoxy-6-polyprenyl-1,4-benzoquinol methylase